MLVGLRSERRRIPPEKNRKALCTYGRAEACEHNLLAVVTIDTFDSDPGYCTVYHAFADWGQYGLVVLFIAKTSRTPIGIRFGSCHGVLQLPNVMP